MGDFTQGGEWPYQIGVFWFYCRFFVSVCLLWKLLKTICITWWIPRGTAHNFFSWRSLVELGENGLWTWLPNIFLKFGVSLVVILTHLEICTGSLDNRFKKPLALSFQNTPWKTDLKMNCLRNFNFKINFFVYLVVCWHYLYQIGFFCFMADFFLGHLIVEIALNFLYDLINTPGNCP